MSSKPAANGSTGLETASAVLVGGGILVMALFPLAIPMIVLLAVAALPLLLLGLGAAMIAATLAAPVLLLRGLRRRRFGGRSRARSGETEPRGTRQVGPASFG